MDDDFEKCVSCWFNEQDGYDQMDWIVGCGEIVSQNIGFFYDYIKKSILGCYFYIDVFSVLLLGWYYVDLESRLFVVD